jgi:UDP-N-acetylmuramyl pentapeptide phosphotransferase/UDP-N-acetylglucosamine-1-phosphate transferase
MTVYVATLVLALSLTAGAVPLVIRGARAANLLDRPGLRKRHANSVPRLGGVAIAFGVVTTLAGLTVRTSSVTWSIRDNWPDWLAFSLAAVAVFTVGLIDDIRGVKASRKLLIQMAAATVVCVFGFRLDTLHFDDHLTVRLGVFAWPITILWITGITNAVNLIDGLDGLAAGIAAIASLVIAGVAVASGQTALAVVMVAVLGALIGFLLFNFHPARIFLGDCGAMTLGFLLAAVSARSAAVTGRAIDIALPVLALIIPILDTLHCIVRRRAERRSVFSSDRGHMHHRLIDIGLSQRSVALILYGITVMASAFGLLMLTAPGMSAILVFTCVLLLVVQLLKAIGAMPLQENLAAMHRNRAIVQQASLDRQAFERARLRFEGIQSFEEWWRALCLSAEEMRLSLVILWLTNHHGKCDRRLWRAPAATAHATPPESLRTTLLVRVLDDAPPALLEIDVPVEGAFESAGFRIQFFTRLIDENSPARFAACTEIGLSAITPSLQNRCTPAPGGAPPDIASGEEAELVLSGVVGIE